MKQKFSKIFASLDFDLLQDQKMTLVDIQSSLSSTESKKIEHLEGIIGLIDRILDRAEENDMWSFENWAKNNSFNIEN